MKQDYLNELSVFVEVARQGGFRAAAQKLHMGAGSISESIKRLEDKLNVRLLERTTRKTALTPDGESLYRQSLPAISDLENAVRNINDNQADIAGKLRLSAPPSCGPLFLNDLMIRFKTQYPNIDLELIYDAGKVDLVTSGIDATIRANSLLEPDTYAVTVGPPIKMVVAASPQYLESNGIPQTPRDITHHDGVCYAFGNPDTLAQWKFTDGNGEYAVQPSPKVVLNDLSGLTLYAEAGLGLLYTYAAFVEDSLAQGRLIPILESYIAPLPRYTINYLSKRHMPNRLKAFIALAKNQYEHS